MRDAESIPRSGVEGSPAETRRAGASGKAESKASSLRRTLAVLRDTTWIQVLLVVAVYRLIAHQYLPRTRLTIEAYDSASPLLAGLQSLEGWLVLLGPLVLLAPFSKRLAWRQIDPECRTRWLVMIPASVLTWSMATLPYNFFFDQAYLVDRLVLVVLLALTWRHPLFVAPLLASCIAFGMQVEQPLVEGDWTWVDKDLPIEVLALFLAYLAARIVIGRPRPWLVAFLFLCLTGGLYWNAALSKLSLGPYPWTWLVETEISNLLISTHLGIDFLGFLSLETIETIAAFAGRFDVLMGLTTLLIEASGLLILVRKRLTLAVLCGFALLHCGIVAASGIFFWKWILIDLGLAWYLVRLQRDGALDELPTPFGPTPIDASPLLQWLRPSRLYAPSTAVLGVLLVVFIRGWSVPVPFAWYDSRYLNAFAIYGVDASGERHRLDGRFFAPYDILISQSRFFYSTDQPILVDTLGSSYHLATLRDLKQAGPESILDVRARHGRVYSDPFEARRLKLFLDRWVTNAQRSKPPLGEFWAHLAPPFHFRSSQPDDAWDQTTPLVRVDIELQEFFWTREQVIPVQRQTVDQILLDDQHPSE